MIYLSHRLNPDKIQFHMVCSHQYQQPNISSQNLNVEIEHNATHFVADSGGLMLFEWIRTSQDSLYNQIIAFD